MQGVLWLLHDELPENLRPSQKLVSPSVHEDEEHLLKEDWNGMKSAAQDIDIWTFPVTSSGVSVLGRARRIPKGKVGWFFITVMWKRGHVGPEAQHSCPGGHPQLR